MNKAVTQFILTRLLRRHLHLQVGTKLELQIPELFKENVFLVGVSVLFSAWGVTISVAKSIIDFYENILITRYLKRVSSLHNSVMEKTLISEYLSKVKDSEAFRLTSGIDAYTEKAVVLMNIYMLGIASNKELKRLSYYLKPKDEKVEIKVNAFDKLSFSYSAISSLLLFILGTTFGTIFLTAGGLPNVLFGFISMFFMMVLALFAGQDYGTSRTLSRVIERLTEKEMVTNPDIKIYWFSKLQLF